MPPAPRRMAEGSLRPWLLLLKLAISLASRDLHAFSTDLTFLQSEVSQLWARNLVQILVLSIPACDLGQLMLTALSLSFHASTLQMGTALPLTNVCQTNPSQILPGSVWGWVGPAELPSTWVECHWNPVLHTLYRNLSATKRRSPACGDGMAAELKTCSTLQTLCPRKEAGRMER